MRAFLQLSKIEVCCSGICIFEGPEGVKWELGFEQIFTAKMGFGSLGITNKKKELGWDFKHLGKQKDWKWDLGKIWAGKMGFIPIPSEPSSSFSSFTTDFAFSLQLALFPSRPVRRDQAHFFPFPTIAQQCVSPFIIVYIFNVRLLTALFFSHFAITDSRSVDCMQSVFLSKFRKGML